MKHTRPHNDEQDDDEPARRRFRSNLFDLQSILSDLETPYTQEYPTVDSNLSPGGHGELIHQISYKFKEAAAFHKQLEANEIRIYPVRKVPPARRNNEFCKDMSCASIGLRKEGYEKKDYERVGKIIQLLFEAGSSIRFKNITFNITGDYFNLSLDKEKKRAVLQKSLIITDLVEVFIHPPSGTVGKGEALKKASLSVTITLENQVCCSHTWPLVFGGNKWESSKFTKEWFHQNKSYLACYISF